MPPGGRPGCALSAVMPFSPSDSTMTSTFSPGGNRAWAPDGRVRGSRLQQPLRGGDRASADRCRRHRCPPLRPETIDRAQHLGGVRSLDTRETSVAEGDDFSTAGQRPTRDERSSRVLAAPSGRRESAATLPDVATTGSRSLADADHAWGRARAARGRSAPTTNRRPMRRACRRHELPAADAIRCRVPRSAPDAALVAQSAMPNGEPTGLASAPR
jgi:hypothetical protein